MLWGCRGEVGTDCCSVRQILKRVPDALLEGTYQLVSSGNIKDASWSRPG